MLPCLCHVVKGSRLELSRDQLTQQLTAKRKGLFDKFGPRVEGTVSAEGLFLWAEGVGSWDHFNNPPEW